MLSFWLTRHRLVHGGIAGALAIMPLALLVGWYLADQTGVLGRAKLAGQTGSMSPSGPPWVYGGEPDARYVITIYADFECPYCKSYFPAVRNWIDRHAKTTLQWHHLPLPFHEPAATRLAITAECMGAIEGQAAFWRTVEWIFLNTRSDGRGLPDNVPLPGAGPTVQKCVTSDAPRDIVQSQAQLAAQEGIDATPTLKLEDRTTGKELVLSGAVEDDALLSALDLLSAEETSDDESASENPADSVDEPR